MMKAVKTSLEDADLALLLVDINDDWRVCNEIFSSLQLTVPAIVIVNKIDTVGPGKVSEALDFFRNQRYCKKCIALSALSAQYKQELLKSILAFLPEGEKYYEGEEITDLSTKFIVGELIREKIYDLFEEEIPYHTTVVVREFKEKPTLVKITAEIIVQRETQKAIILGEKGKMIKRLGTTARKDIEQFLQRKVFLELFVKVRAKWRDNETYLKEYGYI
jgi:GTP-binding protein Era